ncbi:pentatricopeptide repeat-containing protein [Citrus sinensis]|uniref:Pentatricopeptide repeat-containing protein n=1 Tax=Citrus sinensis TaxID=2711 RepID=A0ACB8IHB9_CITSI|nr:pentatricopeptide repeat-containing protein [Citrus sinensis]
MNDLGVLKYFLGIEVSRSKRGIFLSQRKYALDLLHEIRMTACQPINTPIEEGLKFCITSDQVPVDKGRYQKLIGRMMYVSHTRLDLAYALSVIGPGQLVIDALPHDTLPLWEATWSHGEARNNMSLPVQALKQNIEAWPLGKLVLENPIHIIKCEGMLPVDNMFSAPISAFKSNFSSLLVHFRDLTTRTSNSNSNSKNEPSFPATTTKRNDWLLLTAKVKDRASLDKFLKERCKSSGEAFGRILRSCVTPDAATFNSLIQGLCAESRIMEAAALFMKLKAFGCEPDVFTYNTLINGLCRTGHIIVALNGHNPFGLIIVGQVEKALKLFDEMQLNGVVPDSITYATLVDGLCKNGFVLEAVELFHTLKNLKCELNIGAYNCLIDGLCKSGQLEVAWELFQRLPHEGLMPNVVTYNIMIHGLCNGGQMDKAYDLLLDMDAKGVAPNSVIFNTLMVGFIRNNGTSKVIELLHKMKEKKVMPDASVVSIVVDLLVKNEICLNSLPSFPVQEQQKEVDWLNVK